VTRRPRAAEKAAAAAAHGGDVQSGNGALPREQELKYRPRDGAGARYVDASEIAGLPALGAATVVHHDDRYIDTPSRAIASAGYAARIRVDDGEAIVTMKATTPMADGVADRTEVEGPAGALADPAGWEPSPARSMLVDLMTSEPLEEIVTLRQDRTRRRYGDDATSVEVSLDDVDVMLGESVADEFAELEIELLHGDADALRAIKAVLDADPGLRPVKQSKLDRALAAGRRAAERPSAPSPAPEIDALDTLGEAGRKILAFHFGRMVAREAKVRDRANKDIEDLHAMRVAVRRSRAAWRVFEDGLPGRRARRLRDHLAAIGDLLGTVRDLDVLLDEAARYVADERPGDAEALAPLLDGWRGERADAYDRLVDELESDGYRDWADEYRDFVLGVADRAPSRKSDAPDRVRDAVGSRLWALLERVRAYEDVVGFADVATLHRLRMEAKRLRYGLEFLREPLGPETPRLIERVVALQDHVGKLHDADVAAARARALLTSGARLTGDQRSAIARYLSSRERIVARLRRTAYRPFSAIVRPAFRRRLGRAVASI
jgi:CHAD domain-containing protein